MGRPLQAALHRLHEGAHAQDAAAVEARRVGVLVALESTGKIRQVLDASVKAPSASEGQVRSLMVVCRSCGSARSTVLFPVSPYPDQPAA